MGWEILMHRTGYRNMGRIVESGGLDYRRRNDYGAVPGVYFHYLFEDMKNQAYMRKRGVHWNYGEIHSNSTSEAAIMCFRKDLLKDLPFRVCRTLSYGCEQTDDDRTMFEKQGNLKRMPDMKPLRQHIDSSMENPSPGEKMAFTSHEIVVFKRVPITYLAYVLVRGHEVRMEVERAIAGKGVRVPIIDTVYLYRHMQIKHWDAQSAAIAYMAKYVQPATGPESNEKIMAAIVTSKVPSQRR